MRLIKISDWQEIYDRQKDRNDFIYAGRYAGRDEIIFLCHMVADRGRSSAKIRRF